MQFLFFGDKPFYYSGISFEGSLYLTPGSLKMIRLRAFFRIITSKTQREPNYRKRVLYTIDIALMILAFVFGLITGFGGDVLLIVFVLLPLAAIAIKGLAVGSIISICMFLFSCLTFYVPGLIPDHGNYSKEMQIVFPIVFFAAFLISFAVLYDRQRKIISAFSRRNTLEMAVENEHDRLMAMTTQTILSISNAVDARDRYTKRHSARVAEYSLLIAKELNWDDNRLEQLYQIALLHDIGKIGVSDTILSKDSALTEEEYEKIKGHTVIGGEILKDLTLLPNASIGAILHHEQYNGEGYPYGLKGDQIPIEARIIGIADAFDAMNSSRVYRKRMSAEDIMNELLGGRGTQFDPELLDIFIPHARRILENSVI